jgi:dihydroorotase
MIVVRNARVLRSGGVEQTSVVIDGDTIRALGEEHTTNGARVIDADGAWLGPGLVDLHVHFRDPGQTWKENIESGARAAVAGGYTAVMAMPNTEPPIDGGERARAVLERGRAMGTLDLRVAGCLTRGRAGVEMADYDSMYAAGVRIFSDDGDAVPEAGLLHRIMRYLRDLPGAIVAEHAEDRSLAGNGHLHDGVIAARHGIEGLPALAEDVIVARDLEVARATGARIHIQHVSTSGAVELIRRARDRGVDVTSEVTPHHLALDESALERLDPDLKMYPPLRSEEDRAALAAALAEGLIDIAATDHAPHARTEKDVPFEEAPRGVIGLETAAAVVSSALGRDQVAFFDRMSTAPARIAGLDRQGIAVEPGSPANLVLFAPERRWTPGAFASKSQNSPFRGLELTGKVMATFYEGRISYEDGSG